MEGCVLVGILELIYFANLPISVHIVLQLCAPILWSKTYHLWPGTNLYFDTGRDDAPLALLVQTLVPEPMLCTDWRR